MQIALGFIGLFLPGLAWWLWFGDKQQDGGEALARIFAVSFGLITLIALGFYTIRVSLTPVLLGILLGIFFVAVVAGLVRNYRTAFNWGWLIALGVLAVFVGWRLWQARELVFPNWVDSQHHVLIIRKIIETGGVPNTLEPYLPGPFYYHFAFHGVTAFFSVLSGLAPEIAVLILGQVMSAMVGLSVYALAKAISDDWRVGLLAALFVTFVTKMPGYYLTWGRYTLLIGVMILPVAMAEVMRVSEKHDHWWQLIGLSLLTAGILLSHYFTAFLFVLFMILFGFQRLIEIVITKTADWKSLSSVVIAAFAGLVLASRWYYRIFVYSSAASRPVLRVLEAETLKGSWKYLAYLVGPTAGYILLGLGLIGLFWAAIKTKKLHFTAWAASVIFLALPTGFRLMNFRYDYHALIVFIPISVVSAFMIVLLFEKLVTRKKLKNGLILLVGLVLTIFGAAQNLNAINSETVLASSSDVLAFDWIETHIPEAARFFINTVGWSQNTSRGVDGGGWIMPITGRWSVVPTVFYPMNGDDEYVLQTAELGSRASTITDCDADFWSLVRDAQLDYLYIKERVGSLQPGALTSCGGVKQLVHIEDIHIYLLFPTDTAQ